MKGLKSHLGSSSPSLLSRSFQRGLLTAGLSALAWLGGNFLESMQNQYDARTALPEVASTAPFSPPEDRRALNMFEAQSAQPPLLPLRVGHPQIRLRSIAYQSGPLFLDNRPKPIVVVTDSHDQLFSSCVPEDVKIVSINGRAFRSNFSDLCSPSVVKPVTEFWGGDDHEGERYYYEGEINQQSIDGTLLLAKNRSLPLPLISDIRVKRPPGATPSSDMTLSWAAIPDARTYIVSACFLGRSSADACAYVMPAFASRSVQVPLNLFLGEAKLLLQIDAYSFSPFDPHFPTLSDADLRASRTSVLVDSRTLSTLSDSSDSICPINCTANLVGSNSATQ